MARQEFDNSLHKLETEIKIMVSQVELSIEKAMKSLIEQDLVSVSYTHLRDHET